MDSKILTLATNKVNLTPEQAEACIGGFLSVVKKSKTVDKKQFADLMDALPGDGHAEAIKVYEKKVFRKNLPNPAMMLLPRPDFAPPGPPPPVVIQSLSKGISKASRKDKDAGNTQDAIGALVSLWDIQVVKAVEFMRIFVIYVTEETGVNLSDILRIEGVA